MADCVQNVDQRVSGVCGARTNTPPSLSEGTAIFIGGQCNNGWVGEACRNKGDEKGTKFSFSCVGGKTLKAK